METEKKHRCNSDLVTVEGGLLLKKAGSSGHAGEDALNMGGCISTDAAPARIRLLFEYLSERLQK